MATGLLEWYFPTAGYAYAGNWSRGIPSALVRLVGAGLVLEDQFVIMGHPPPCEARCKIGVGLYLAGTVGGIVDAVHVARRENERRRKAAGAVSLAPFVSPGGSWGLTGSIAVGGGR